MGDDLSLIQTRDVFLVPVCLLIMFVIAYLVRKKYRRTPLEKYFFPALFFRFFCAFIYALVIQYYYGAGDTTMYYKAVTDIRNGIDSDPSMWQIVYGALKLDPASPIYPFFMYDGGYVTHFYMLNLSNYMVPKFALPFSFLFMNSYLCICFCFSLFSFAGCWRIYKMMTDFYPHLHKKFAVAILFLPSVLFWGSSLMKDSICMGAMGMALYAAYKIFMKKEKVFISLVLLILNGLLLYYIKPYILLCLIPAFLLWIFLGFRQKIQDKTLRSIAGFLFGSISILAGVFALQALTQSEMASQYSTDKLLQTVQGVQGSFGSADVGGGSSFSVGDASTSVASSLVLFPLGLVATLFRPFPWEASNPLIAFSALEAFGFLFLTYVAFRRIGFKKFFRYSFSDSVVIFCFVYSILFAGIVGVTTTNFGALVRYKIPCVPFYLFTLFIVMDKSGKFSPNVIFHKKLF
jgi:hypothetical protein